MYLNTNMKQYVLTIFVIVIMPTFVRAIFGGEDVKDPHKYPWIVKITSQYVYRAKEYVHFQKFDNVFHVYSWLLEGRPRQGKKMLPVRLFDIFCNSLTQCKKTQVK